MQVPRRLVPWIFRLAGATIARLIAWRRGLAGIALTSAAIFAALATFFA